MCFSWSNYPQSAASAWASWPRHPAATLLAGAGLRVLNSGSSEEEAEDGGKPSDEPLALQNIAANVIVNNGKDSIILDSNSPTNPLLIKIGELCFDVKHDEEEKFLAAVSSVQPHMLIFKGINLCKQEKKFLQIGSMQVEINHAETPG